MLRTWYTARGVLNVPYKREDTAQAVKISEVIADTSTNCSTIQSINQETDDTDEAGVENTDGLTGDSNDEAESQLVPLLSPNIRDLIQKVRKVVFIFKTLQRNMMTTCRSMYVRNAAVNCLF